MTWIFGYGSLMWNPGFAVCEKRPAMLRGYHRAYMMYSTRNRGTPESPGMVLSLAPGGQCIGMAMRVEPGQEAEALAYLDKREGANRANKRVLVPIHWRGAPEKAARDNGTAGNGTAGSGTAGNGAPQHASTYLPILTYSNYIWGVPLERQAELVARGCGKTGTALDYLSRVLEELQRLQVQEPALERLFAEATRCLDTSRAPAPALLGD
jgi:glutathione-specific gamma-glutamylcyclotransferase